MVNNKNKTLGIVLGIFALVIVTTAASFAFFTYSRVGNTTTTITSGDIEFSYNEGASAELANAFPLSDTVGAADTTKEYTFTVNMKSSSTSNKMNYNVYLMDANDATGVNYFTNEQIKFALVKNGTYVAGTSSTLGKKLSEVPGFNEGSYEGEGLVLKDQAIASNVTDTYKLRIWISDDVKYSNTSTTGDGTDENNDTQTSVGKYNGYKYSLKVKVTAGMGESSSTVVNTPTVNNLTMTAEVSDPNGLYAYAVTTASTAPADDSSEWITITDGSAKSNVIRTATVTTKSITFMVKKNGTHYLHVKNKLGKVKSETFTANATGENAVDKIVGLAETNTNELRIDEHAATGQQTFATKEYRYYGVTPNNYVWFNNELWRIIGAMDVDDGSNPDGTGNVDKRLKIIRANSIGNYSWDSSDENTNNGLGVNEWSQADLMSLLNSGVYYNRTTGTCYNGPSNATTSCDFTENGLTQEAKEMIGNAKWYLGAPPSSYSSLTATDFYGYERGTYSGKQCSRGTYCDDSVTRTTSWTGQIGLMYPSDYGYSANITSCSTTALLSYNTSCKDSSWLFNSTNFQWTLSPRPGSSYAGIVFSVDSTGLVGNDNARIAYAVSPVTYLTSNIKILDGDGTTERPFVLSK